MEEEDHKKAIKGEVSNLEVDLNKSKEKEEKNKVAKADSK